MLEISSETVADFERAALQRAARRLRAAFAAMTDLAAVQSQFTERFCVDCVVRAHHWGIAEDDDVARWSRIRVLRGDAWMADPAAQEVLTSGRSGLLKAFQIECLHRGIADG